MIHRLWLNPSHGPMLTGLAGAADAELVWATYWRTRRIPGLGAGWPAVARVCSDPAALEVAHPAAAGHMESAPRGGVGRPAALCLV